ncbi:hypothetical protein HW555_001986 [Spodoptera exigua]|uniref:Protein VAC14 homolog n=1 Tax=Spodoptera exigua TaxID=7107 RepID=A0A835GR82_SPOEX|nr:hypothetical protein HW555_001986 [Spodoptera exigua]
MLEGVNTEDKPKHDKIRRNLAIPIYSILELWCGCMFEEVLTHMHSGSCIINVMTSTNCSDTFLVPLVRSWAGIGRCSPCPDSDESCRPIVEFARQFGSLLVNKSEMSERDYAPLSIACVRGLCDKIYDKRKFAGVEIEKMVKDFSDAKNTSQIKRLIRVLGQDLMSSTNPNVKNGALMGLSSVAVGLGKGCIDYLPELVHPIVACFSESESRVRYQAAEALFNVLKIARGEALAHFPLVFDALARLAADPEPQVKQGAELLDRLVKDIVTESQTFELAAFIPMLRERIYTRNAFGRQFIVSWVSVLDAVPDIDLIVHLPELLDGLFKMLDDANAEIRRMCDVQLNEFLRSIKKDPSRVDFQAMINILITHAQSPEEMLQLTAITWIKEFVELAGATMLPYASGILCAVLPCLAYSDEPRKSIRETAVIVNFQLTKLVVSGEAGEVGEAGEAGQAGEARQAGEAGQAVQLELDGVVAVLTQMLHHSSVSTKVAALDWILHLYNKLPAQVLGLRIYRYFRGVKYGSN